MSAVQEFFKKHVIPLVGHRKPANDAKRYTARPLVVVYYGVDFSFDFRKGEGPSGLTLDHKDFNYWYFIHGVVLDFTYFKKEL